MIILINRVQDIYDFDKSFWINIIQDVTRGDKPKRAFSGDKTLDTAG